MQCGRGSGGVGGWGGGGGQEWAGGNFVDTKSV